MPMASAFILLPFYLEFLPTAVYGEAVLYLAFSLLIQILVIYSFDSSTYIHYHEYKDDPDKLSAFISSAFIFMLLLSVAVGLVLILLGELIFNQVFEDRNISFYPYGLMALGAGIFQALTKVYSNILQSSERPLQFLWSNLLLFALIVGFTILGLYFFPGTVMGPIGGRLLAGMIVAVWVLWSVFRNYGFQFNYPLLKSTFGYNHYAFIHQIQQWGINYLDRFIMLPFLSLATIGVYDFVIKCLVVIEILTNSLHNSFLPKVVGTITLQPTKQSTIEINRYYYGLTAITMIMVCCCIFIYPILFNFLELKQGYSETILIFPYIALTFIPRSIRYYYAVPFGILKYTKPLPLISTLVSVVKIGLMVWWIPLYGIPGIVSATLLSLLVEMIILRWTLENRFRFQYNWYKLVMAPGLLVIIILILEPTYAQQFSWQIHLLYLVLTGVLLAWVYRNELKWIKIPFR